MPNFFDQLLTNRSYQVRALKLSEPNKCTIACKINFTPKGIRLSEKLQHSLMKFDRSSKFNYVIMGK